MTLPLTIAVASGKGGTGKTLVATNLAYVGALAGNDVALVDCDAEAPNDTIFLRPDNESVRAVETACAEVDASACTACGACRDACAYKAVRVLGSSALVFPEMCHGCGVCVGVCPTGAIFEVSRRVGEIRAGSVAVPHGDLTVVSGRLDVGEVKTPLVIRSARSLAEERTPGMTVLDAPPGVACSAVAAVRKADVLLLVTEPTPFGLHDLELSYRLGQDLGIPMGVIVNRAGWGSADVDAWCAGKELPVLARIPFDRSIAGGYAEGELLAREESRFRELFETLLAGVIALAGARDAVGVR